MSTASDDPLFGNRASELLQAAADAQPTMNGTDWQPPSPDFLQTHLPSYQVHEFIARGGMGAVYRGLQISLNRQVAIKILPPQLLATDPHFAERFKQEAQAMAQFSHPNIVSVFDFGQMADGTLFFVMEFIHGTDVAHMIHQQGRLSSAHAMAITAHVCDALQCAHEHGVVHRDIKPANIIVGYDGRVKVADFGLAKSGQNASASLTVTGHVMGTPHYVAPEALTLGMSIDHRADIYAVGVMLYQMLTGKLPQGLFEMPSLKVPGLDPRYDRIVASAMREDRDQRYQRIGDMRQALDAILTQPVQIQAEAHASMPQRNVVAEPAHQKPGGSGQPQRSPQRQTVTPAPRKKTSVVEWVALLAVLGLVAGGALWVFRSTESGGGKRAEGDEAPSNTSSDPSITLKAATKEQPFVNTLGMKFVPVPETDVLFCIHETRYEDWQAYASAVTSVNPRWKDYINLNGKVISERMDDHPVKNVNYDDAVGFCQWLSNKEGRTYRLPTDREWSHAVGIGNKEDWSPGTTPAMRSGKLHDEYPWGTAWPPPKGSGNYRDSAGKEVFQTEEMVEGYADGFPVTSPVMSFKPNILGIYDMGGNEWEWVDDWHNEEQKARTLRGGSWYEFERGRLQSSARIALPPAAYYGNANHGFRCVLQLSTTKTGAVQEPTPKTMASGTKEQPLVNSLGMKFVPVPGTNVLMCIHSTRVKDYQAFAGEHPTGNNDWQHPKDNRREYPASPDHAVTMVNWFDANSFCVWLSKKEGRTYRLPKDEEWRAAAEFTLKNPPLANELSDYRKTPKPTVTTWRPNALGIHDLGFMGGEWCADNHPRWNDLKLLRQFIVERAGADNATGFKITVPQNNSDETEGDGPDARRPHTVFRCVIEL